MRFSPPLTRPRDSLVRRRAHARAFKAGHALCSSPGTGCDMKPLWNTLSATVLLLVCCRVMPATWSRARALERHTTGGMCTAPLREYDSHFVVFGDSKDWFVWSDWCVASRYRLSRICKEYSAYECSSYPHTDMVCFDEDDNPVVIMWMFYGVALHAPYHHKYNGSHSIPNIPANSILRLEYLLKLSRKLFSRTEEYIIFASCAWDIERLIELNQELRVEDWLTNASVLITRLKKLEVSTVILRTSQAVKRHTDLTLTLNEATVKLSEITGSTLLNTSACLGGLDEEYRLRDDTHPTTISALRISQCALIIAQAAISTA